jgi:hypothetical protein
MPRFAAVLTGGLLALFMTGAGCQRHALYEYDDEPYLAAYARRDTESLQALLRRPYWDEREIALRLMAGRARRLVESGRTEEGGALVRTLLDHYREHERDARVRSMIVGVMLRDAAVRSGAVREFLCERLARGECVIDACHTYAALGLPEAYDVIAPFLAHPRKEVRYEAALALTLLDDARTVSAIRRLLAQMQPPGWPRVLLGMPLAQRRAALRSRVSRRAAALEENGAE